MIDALKNICGASRLPAQVFENLLEFNIRKYQAQYATKDLAAGNSTSAIQMTTSGSGSEPKKSSSTADEANDETNDYEDENEEEEVEGDMGD